MDKLGSLSVEVPSQDEKTTPEGTSLATSPGVLTSESPTTCTTRHSVPPSEGLQSVQKRPQLNIDTKPESEGLEPLHKKPRLDTDAEHNGCITSLASSESFEKKLSLDVCTEHSTSPPPNEVPQKPPFGCGCGRCTFFSFIKCGCPTPIPSASSFPYLDLSGLTQWQEQELRGRLRSESQDIMIKFQKLVSATIKSFEERCVPVDNLVSHVMALGAFDPVFKESQVPAFHHRFEELKAADTVTKVFIVLNNYFSFFNYHILEHIIEEIGTKEDKERLKTYKEDFNQYAKRRIFECPLDFGPVSDAGHTDILVKLDVKYENSTLAAIELFCHKLSEVVHISFQGILCLCRIDKGCFELTFQVPSFVQQKIFPLSREQKMALEEEGVINLKCGEYHFSSKKHGRFAYVAT